MKRIMIMLFLPMVASAEPGPATQYLMQERASLFDIGMMRLETLTTEFANRVGLHWTDGEAMSFFRAEIHPAYEPENDSIYVYISVTDSRPTEAQMAEGCENALYQMNIWLTKSLSRLFTHTGYDDPAAPPGLHRSLADMFELRCVFSSPASGEGRFWATRDLGVPGDRQMEVGKWKMRNE